MILLQHAVLAPPKQPSPSPPMSVATRSTGTLQLPPQKPFGQEASLPLAGEEELSKEGEQDCALEELCKPLYCKLCNVTLNSAQQAQAHYQMGSFKPGGRVILATENDYCKLCDASFSSPAVAQAHYQGKNHAKRLRLAEAQSNSFSESTELGQRRARKEGNEFKMMPNRRNMYTVQNNSAGPYFNPRSRQRIPRDLAMCVTPSGQFYCSMCNVGAGEEMEFRQHLESKQHKSKVSEQRYRNEMENLGYV
ncbi:zinc finger matrin-type protein 3 isoform X3 [Rhinopithecus roxellana]|uniref:zinc finger matrin-type protein 3 isoform X3 n=1 Tax=Rhinopithecus roxellana TaxID=61622 RepID=UPI0012375099|nr:zinc finger matrin-type protein 3 isoform X3 [Rhinopithecus roxellana]